MPEPKRREEGFCIEVGAVTAMTDSLCTGELI